jgi:hypothetical protein
MPWMIVHGRRDLAKNPKTRSEGLIDYADFTEKAALLIMLIS